MAPRLWFEVDFRWRFRGTHDIIVESVFTSAFHWFLSQMFVVIAVLFIGVKIWFIVWR